MKFDELINIIWWAYAGGFLYIWVLAPIFIGLYVDYVDEIIGAELAHLRKKHRWQPVVVGIIERTLYVTSLLGNQAGFIVLWVGLKVAVPYIRWSSGQQVEEAGTAIKKRSLYIISLYGNALSILYAVAGYIIIRLLAENYCGRALVIGSAVSVASFL